MNEPTDSAPSQHGGAELSGDAKSHIEGDLVAGDKNMYGDSYEDVGDLKIVKVGAGAQVTQAGAADYLRQTISQNESASSLASLFTAIYQRIGVRPEDPNVDRDEIQGLVRQIQNETARGAAANAVKVERWLGQLKQVAPDICKLATAALVNPVAEASQTVVAAARRLTR